MQVVQFMRKMDFVLSVTRQIEDPWKIIKNKNLLKESVINVFM